ncbi:MAG: FecR family protein [Mariprofundaceae bacterium]|nr:FecR family protein [Mariprofundaceae bacterium]
MLRFFYAMVLCCFLMFSGTTYAAVTIGTVVTVGGDAQVERAGARIPVTLGQALFQSDTIITGAKGRVKLMMADKSKVYIGSRTKISLSTYVVEEKGLIKATLDMAWGKARFFVNKLVSRKSSFEVRTSTAVLGVRGTGWLTEVVNGQTIVTQFEGVLSVQTAMGTFSVHDGQVASIDAAGVFNIRPATQQEMSRQRIDPDIGDNTMGGGRDNQGNDAQGNDAQDNHVQDNHVQDNNRTGSRPSNTVVIPERGIGVLLPEGFTPLNNNTAMGGSTANQGSTTANRGEQGNAVPPPPPAPPPVVIQNAIQQSQTAVHIQPRFVLP